MRDSAHLLVPHLHPLPGGSHARAGLAGCMNMTTSPEAAVFPRTSAAGHEGRNRRAGDTMEVGRRLRAGNPPS